MPRRFSRIRYVRTAAGLALDAFREGRLPLSPSRWLVDLRHLRQLMSSPSPDRDADPRGAVRAREDTTRKAALADARRSELAAFLRSNERLAFSCLASPRVSVLLVLHNRAELTLACLRALADVPHPPLEVVIVDNQSTDGTAELLGRLDGTTVIRWDENRGFIKACNEAARVARGEVLLLLNNDAELAAGSLEHAASALEASPSVGAVGGRLILPDGTLQEAGSVVWADGSCEGYGRGDDPWKPEYAFARDVDYCSAALLMTPRRVFENLGGFDERFEPAYYEDADYCLRLWQAGLRVVYRPDVVALHHEFSSSASREAAVAMQQARRVVFARKHEEWLALRHRERTGGLLDARARREGGLRVLVVDDRVPDRTAGFGFPRAAELVDALVALGHFVTLYPMAVFDDAWPRVRESVPETVEVMSGIGPARFKAFMKARAGYYDRIIVSRFHNMELVRAKLGPPGTWSPGAAVIFDAEAVSALREVGRRRAAGESISDELLDRMVAREVALSAGADAVIAVSEVERNTLGNAGCPNVQIVGHAVSPAPTERRFEDRRGILFVGAFHDLSPNADGVSWFVTQVLPLLRSHLGSDLPMTVVGPNPPEGIRALESAGVRVCGFVPDLTPLYDEARLFVAPTRFAAGIPLKVIHAAAAGLPVVATSLLSRQLGWTSGRELLVADRPDAFAAACRVLMTRREDWRALREAALKRVTSDFSRDRFRASLAAVLG